MILWVLGFPGASVVKNLPAMQEMPEMWVRTLGWEDPLEKGMATHSSILMGKSHGQRRPVGYGPWRHRVGHDWNDWAHCRFHPSHVGCPAGAGPGPACPGSFLSCGALSSWGLSWAPSGPLDAQARVLVLLDSPGLAMAPPSAHHRSVSRAVLVQVDGA